MITLEFLRQFRIGDYAVFDSVVSLLGAYILAPLLSKFFYRFRIVIPRINWLYLTLPISIFVHILIGLSTPLTRNFLDMNGHYILKLVILVLTGMGMRGIKMTNKVSSV